jgi:hypothetical protein
MKKIVDKPSKTVLYVITLLLFGTITLRGDASLSRSADIQEKPVKVIAKIAESSDKVNNAIVVAKVTEAVVAPKPEIKTEIKPQVKIEKTFKPLSRGGDTSKEFKEHEKINNYIREIAPKYNIEPELIMSMIVSESDYDPNATTGKCLGLMQVSTRWHGDRAKRLGVDDFYDPYSNILLGVDYLSELFAEYKDTRLVLMMYNMDHKRALDRFENGQISNYAKTIIERAENLKKGE